MNPYATNNTEMIKSRKTSWLTSCIIVSNAICFSVGIYLAIVVRPEGYAYTWCVAVSTLSITWPIVVLALYTVVLLRKIKRDQDRKR